MKKKKFFVVFITGDQTRHYYVYQKFSKIFKNSIHIKISKKNKKDKIHSSKIYKKHINLIKKLENKILKLENNLEKNSYLLQRDDKYVSKLYSILSINRPDVIITYGCPFLEERIYKLAKKYHLNIHGGLSPWYKGAITNFWPTFLLKPANTGFTLHEISMNIDSGNIFFQTNIKPKINHGIIENNIYALIKFCRIIPNKLERMIYSNKKYKGIKQKSNGKIWTKNDFSDYLLNIVYKFYNDRINLYVKKNNIKYKKLKLFNIF